MEYLLLILLVVPIFIVYKLINTSKSIPIRKTVFTTQSRNLQMIGNIYQMYQDRAYKGIKSQSTDYFDNKYPRILIMENEGFWIENNAVYRANFNGEAIDQETKTKLDTMTMNDVELKKLIFIIEQLTKD